ncbi:hypothetical protein PENTCL1PPCAC_14868, partial [Pristionchus entomophagus]
FHHSASSTFKNTTDVFRLLYGSGSVRGSTGYDVLDMAGLKHHSQGFGVATQIAPVFGNQPVDGVLGLGWPALGAYNKVVPPMQNLLDRLAQPVFTVFMKRYRKSYFRNQNMSLHAVDGGVITFGGYDKANCHHEVHYVPLTSKIYWQFKMVAFSMGDFRTDITYQVISDTGTSWIGCPNDVFNAIVKRTNVTYSQTLGLWLIDCEGTFPDMVFKIGRLEYSVPAFEYVLDLGLSPAGTCVLGAFPIQGTGFGPQFILGDVFIRQFCTVHDIGKARIGFARS